MAEAAGLALVPPGQRDPKRTTTYGVGQLIRAALDVGPEEILIGIGGSATNDGGVGMAMALGVEFRDSEGTPVLQGGGALLSLATVDLKGLDGRIAGTKITVACDVTNPLTGPEGAAAVFGPQKGASKEDVQLLDRGLERLATVLKSASGIDIRRTPGSGAAGGLGGGLVGFLGGLLRPGIEIVLDLTAFNDHLQGTDLVLTGEGKLDTQTRFGKALSGVLRRAGHSGIPVIAVVGSIEGGEFVGEEGFAALSTLVSGDVTLEEALSHASPLLRQRTASLVRRYLRS
jgi:glycerate kinase